MEMIFSSSRAYLIIREARRSHKCRVSVGRDNDKSLYVLNQLRDKRLIAKHWNTFDEAFPDFVESFVYNGSYFIVFRYHEGSPFCEARAESPVQALDICEAVCFAALGADIPADFFCQLIEEDCIVLRNGEARFNAFFTFLEEDGGWDYAAQKLAEELAAFIEEADFHPAQMKTLDKMMKRLDEPFHHLLELYLFVRDFRKAYQPMETAEILKSWRETSIAFMGEALQKLLFYGAVLSAFLASLFILWNAVAPPGEEDMLIKQVGGYTLSEQGSIDESDFGETDETDYH